MRKPSSEKLLPDYDGNEANRKPTLVINLDDCLVHMTYTPQTGWRVKKRPYVDRFLEEVSKHYEIVIFSDQNMMTAVPIVERLDPQGKTSKLYRDATYYKDGKNVKVYSYLVIFFDLRCLLKRWFFVVSLSFTLHLYHKFFYRTCHT